MERYQDRFESRGLDDENPIEVRVASEPIGSGELVPEPIFWRLVMAGRAYNLHILGNVLTWGEVCSINSLQCDSLLDELAFVREVLNDLLVGKAIGELQGLVARCARVGQDLIVDLEP